VSPPLSSGSLIDVFWSESDDAGDCSEDAAVDER